MMLAQRLGWPKQLTRSYISYLDGLERSFRLHDGMFAPTMSKIGVPEGDPLAVPIMIMVTWAITSAVHKAGGSMPSYVDNWVLLAPQPQSLQPLLDVMKWATDGLALILNGEKTKAFATLPKHRNQLRALTLDGHPLQIMTAVNELGVTFKTVHQASVHSLQKRYQQCDVKFQRLQALKWTAKRKSQVLLRVIYPALFFGVELSPTSPTFLSTVRSRFSAVIWGTHHNRNHFLAPLLGGEILYEPFLLVWRQRMKALRRAFHQQPAVVVRRWNFACQASNVHGPLRYFLDMLSQLGCTFLSDMRFQCQDVVWHVGFSNLGDMQSAITQAWFSYASYRIRTKHTLQDVDKVDFNFSRQLQKSTMQSQAILGSFATGTAMFTAQKQHFLDDAQARCIKCGALDSQRHRLLECPATLACRANLNVSLLSGLPPLQLERLLFEAAPAIRDWQFFLQSTPYPTFNTFFYEHVDLFTDGSTCHVGSIPRSTWAVTLAEPNNLEAAFFEQGQLFGCQTNFRAELFAVVVAVQSATGATIHCDSLSVVQGFQKLLARGWCKSLWAKQQHADLWYLLWLSLQPKLRHGWNIHHVRSHRDFREQPDAFSAWTAFHNAKADEAARSVQGDDSLHATNIHLRALHAFQQQACVAKEIATLQCAVMQVAGGETVQAVRPLQVQDGQVAPSLGSSVVLCSAPQALSNETLLCPTFLWMLHQFLAECSWHETDVPFSLHELYVLFLKVKQWITPVNVGKWDVADKPGFCRNRLPSAWLHETQWEPLKLHRPSFAKQLKIFYHCLHALTHSLNLPWSFVRGKHLAWLDCHSPVMAVTLRPTIQCLDSRQLLASTMDGYSFSKFSERRHDPVLRPAHCPVSDQMESVQVRWNRYHVLRRSS